jgi:hypothetical protein
MHSVLKVWEERAFAEKVLMLTVSLPGSANLVETSFWGLVRTAINNGCEVGGFTEGGG